MRDAGMEVHRVGAIEMLTAQQVKQQLNIRQFCSPNVRVPTLGDPRAALKAIVEAEVQARKACGQDDGVTSEDEVERLKSFGLGKKQRRTQPWRRPRKTHQKLEEEASASESEESGDDNIDAEVLQGPDVHKVERILDMRRGPNGREFLIKWQGWSTKWNGAWPTLTP